MYFLCPKDMHSIKDPLDSCFAELANLAKSLYGTEVRKGRGKTLHVIYFNYIIKSATGSI